MLWLVLGRVDHCTTQVLTFFFIFQEMKSRETEIHLRKVDLNTTGQFRCEISGEAPLFQTAHKEGIMAVVGKISIYILKWNLTLIAEISKSII